MIRTQVYLTDEQAQYNKDRAQSEQRRQADVVRELLDRGRLTSQTKTGQGVADFLARLEALHLSGPTDLSTTLDDYLYGDKA